MESAIYFPVLRGRQGEIEALYRLSSQARAWIAPLVDMPEKEFDSDEAQTRYVQEFSAQVSAAWGTRRPIYLDMSRYGPERVDERQRPIVEHLFDCARLLKMQAIPVTGTLRDRGPHSAYFDGVARIAKSDGRGLALRISYADFSDPDTFAHELSAALSSLGLSAEHVDLFLDAESIPLLPPPKVFTHSLAKPGTLEDHLLATLVQALSVVQGQSFRHIVFLGSSVPEKLHATNDGGPRQFTRVELRVWKELTKQARLPLVRFADTGVWGPRQPDTGGGGGGPPPARVRLPIGDQQVFFRAENREYRTLCRDVMDYPGVRELAPSWGLDAVRDCGLGGGRSEGPTQWVARDTNIHLEITTKQIQDHLRQQGRLNEIALPPVQATPWGQTSLIDQLR